VRSQESHEGKGSTSHLMRASEREIRKEVVVAASPFDVWKRWTTKAGVGTFFAPHARIDLAIGGAYEMIFMPEAPAGSRGSEGCTILSFLPGKMLSFTWNAPPHIPDVRKELSWVVVFLEPVEGGKTRVLLVHQGWKTGEGWDKAFGYFDRAWELVVARLRHAIEMGPMDWDNPYVPEELRR
jgi:uncharacterized protein YndB with AHSA1/START domain